MIKYFLANDLRERVELIVRALNWDHIDLDRVVCIRSTGSGSRRTLARCHALGKIWHTALDVKPHYLIEVLTHHYEKLPQDEKDKILIHELMHIPHSFGGGFRNHRPYVTKRKVDKNYREFIKKLNPRTLF
jgi:predicted metallopeptidase